MMETRRFSQELQFVSGCVKKKTTIPILSNVLIEQTKRACTLSGTDLEIAAVSAFKGDGVKMRTTVGSKMLRDALKSLKDVEEFDIAADSKGLAIGANGFATTLATLSPDSYPDLPTLPEDGVQLPYRELAAMLTAAKHAISEEKTRFTLNGALLEYGRDVLRVVATDGHRLCVTEHRCEPKDKSLLFLVMSRSIPLIAQLAKDGTCGIFNDGKHHHFFVGSPAPGVSRVLLQRHMEGSFPDYQRVMPTAFKFKATVNRDELKRTVNQIIPMTDERSRAGKLIFEKNTLSKSALTIQASVSETGSSKATIGVDCQPGAHGSFTIGFNLKFIVDALVAMKGCEKVTLCLNPARAGEDPKAMQIDGTVDGIAVREIIMPVRI